MRQRRRLVVAIGLVPIFGEFKNKIEKLVGGIGFNIAFTVVAFDNMGELSGFHRCPQIGTAVGALCCHQFVIGFHSRLCAHFFELGSLDPSGN